MHVLCRLKLFWGRHKCYFAKYWWLKYVHILHNVMYKYTKTKYTVKTLGDVFKFIDNLKMMLKLIIHIEFYPSCTCLRGRRWRSGTNKQCVSILSEYMYYRNNKHVHGILVFLYGPFCYGDLKLYTSTTFFLLTSLHFFI